MKCPYRKITIDNGYNEIIEEFAECYEEECPFYGKAEYKKRYNGGYTEVTSPVCQRACVEGEDKK